MTRKSLAVAISVVLSRGRLTVTARAKWAFFVSFSRVVGVDQTELHARMPGCIRELENESAKAQCLNPFNPAEVLLIFPPYACRVFNGTARSP